MCVCVCVIVVVAVVPKKKATVNSSYTLFERKSNEKGALSVTFIVATPHNDRCCDLE